MTDRNETSKAAKHSMPSSSTLGRPPRVVVIGCGPGGMFFCHALETQRRQLQEKGDSAGLARLPIVTCFEVASGPGGVWRTLERYTANNDNDNSNTAADNTNISAVQDTAQTTIADSDSADNEEEKKTDDPNEINVQSVLSLPSNAKEAAPSRGKLNGTSLSSASAAADGASTTTASTTDTASSAASLLHNHSTAPPITNMYEALWTNGPKECMEFFDYTYQEHFGYRLPVYMPRGALLDYMTARVTKHCPTFFQDYVRFQTKVHQVRYDEHGQHFVVDTVHTPTKTNERHIFDYCVWAAGDNGKPKIPRALVSTLHNGGYTGTVIHSTDTSDFEHHVRGKRVLMVGGSYSAEDLALVACKLGVKRLYINSRTDDNVVTWMGAWPGDKVELLLSQTLTGVFGDNRRGLEFSETERTGDSDGFGVADGTSVSTRLQDIDTVVLCTGYKIQVDMLEPSLAEPLLNDRSKDCVEIPDNDNDTTFQLPPTPADQHLGIVPLESSAIRYDGTYLRPLIYRGVLMSNPRMMYLRHDTEEIPILGVDAVAWMLLKHIREAGANLPSPQEMAHRNHQQALDELQLPFLRYYMDRNYQKVWDNKYYELPKTVQKELDEAWYKAEMDATVYDVSLVARDMAEAGMPVSFGNVHQLNDKGKSIVEMENLSGKHRWALEKDNDTASWKTFRDTDDADQFKSVFSEQTGVPLKKRWMDIDNVDDPDLLRP